LNYIILTILFRELMEEGKNVGKSAFLARIER